MHLRAGHRPAPFPGEDSGVVFAAPVDVLPVLDQRIPDGLLGVRRPGAQRGNAVDDIAHQMEADQPVTLDRFIARGAQTTGKGVGGRTDAGIGDPGERT